MPAQCVLKEKGKLEEVEVEEMLKKMRGRSTAVTLDGIDDIVIALFRSYRNDTLRIRRYMFAAALLSLGAGTMVGVNSVETAAKARSVSPFAPVTALAPSTLLDSR